MSVCVHSCSNTTTGFLWLLVVIVTEILKNLFFFLFAKLYALYVHTYVHAHLFSDEFICVPIVCLCPWEWHSSISIFMNNPVTSVRETDGEWSAGSMSLCLWHANEQIHCVTASLPNILALIHTVQVHTLTLCQAYSVPRRFFPNCFSPTSRLDTLWHLRGQSAFFFLSLDAKLGCGDPNVTLSQLNLELNELLNQTQEIPLIFTVHTVSHECFSTFARTWKLE